MSTSQPYPLSVTPQPEVPSTMQAVVYDDYGGPEKLHVVSRNVPEPGDDQLLIRVAATGINPIDYRLRAGEMKGLLPGGFPRIPGFDVAGVVVRCPEASRFEVGQRVMAFLDHTRGGACAEYASCSTEAAAVVPDTMSFDVAAAIPLAGTTAIQSLRDHGKVQAGDRVLVNGASGGVGMFAVQVAKAYGCVVDAVASASNEQFCRSLGADRFFNYETTDFTALKEKWDVIFDAAGKSSYFDVRAVMTDDGRYVTTEPDVKGMLMTLLTWPLSKSGTVMLAKSKAEDLEELVELYKAGKLQVTIDRRFSMAHAADAHRYLETGAQRGKCIIQIV